jgi:hypothetical protein
MRAAAVIVVLGVLTIANAAIWMGEVRHGTAETIALASAAVMAVGLVLAVRNAIAQAAGRPGAREEAP